MAAAMEPDRLARLGFWAFALGNLAWAAANLTGQTPSVVNSATDVVVFVGALLAAAGLPDAVDSFGAGRFRTGLALVAVPELGQNAYSAATRLGPFNAAPILVVLLASAALLVGVWRWRGDGWVAAAAPWIMAGFTGLAFEPVYYFLRGLASNPFGPFFPGAVGVALGGTLLAWSFRPGAEADVVPLLPPPAPSAAPAKAAAKSARRSRS